jgi:proliferating cell nuclear antigen PCNA
MEFSPKNPALFKSTVNALSEFLPKVLMNISNSGIVFGGLEKDHVCYFDYKLSDSDCNFLKVPRPCKVGVDMKILYQTLMHVGIDDELTIALGTGKTSNKLFIKYTNSRANKKVVYEISTFEIDNKMEEIPDQEYEGIVKIKTADIFAAVKEVSIFDSETITLHLDEDGLHISAIGTVGNAIQTLENTDDREMFMGDESVKSTFSKSHLIDVLKAGSAISPLVSLEYGKDIALRSSFLFGTDSRLIVYIAPKYLNDD